MNYSIEYFLNKAMRYCSGAERCCFDVRQKFRVWKVKEIWQDEIIDQLISNGFLNEERYVEAYVNDKINLSKWGRIKIRFNLQQKQLPSSLINQFLDAIDLGKYKGNAEKIMLGKLISNPNKDSLRVKDSVFRFMSSRGYEPEIIHHCWGRLRPGVSEENQS